MLTVLEIIKKTSGFLADKGVESPRLNAEHLIGHALGLRRMQLYLQFERQLAEAELEKIRPLVRRRASREPLQHILGETEFCGLKIKCDRRALIPRPETEQLVELVTALLPAPPAAVLDLGTGTGCLALVLAKHWPEARVTAVDASADALALAADNTAALSLSLPAETPAPAAPPSDLAARITFLRSDWFAALPAGSRFDLIVANPPYLTAAETAAAAPEVRDFDPAAALTAGDDGLADLKAILAAAPAWLAPGGLLALETGIAHHAALLPLAAAANLVRVESRQDHTKRDRFLLAWQP
jgi:release factor glutamine methyltransferase